MRRMTDQILLSQYFCDRFQFYFDAKKTKVSQRFGNVEESFVYSRGGNDSLSISRTGGKDNLPSALDSVWNTNSLDTGLFFDHVAVITDHDSEEEADSLNEMLEKTIQKYGTLQKIQGSDWHAVEMENRFQQKKQSEFFTLFIPLDHPGALETFLLDSLNSVEENRYIVQRLREFVNSLSQDYDREKEKFPPSVLSSRRLRVKAPLAVFFGVTNPEGGFRRFETFLKEIDWSNYENIQQGFKVFDSVFLR